MVSFCHWWMLSQTHIKLACSKKMIEYLQSSKFCCNLFFDTLYIIDFLHPKIVRGNQNKKNDGDWYTKNESNIDKICSYIKNNNLTRCHSQEQAQTLESHPRKLK